MYDTFLRDVETYFEEVRLLKRGARGSVTLLRHRSTGKRYIFRRFTGSAEVYQVDIDQESDLAAQYGVMSVPTLIVFKNGKPVNQSLGFMPKERVLALIQNS